MVPAAGRAHRHRRDRRATARKPPSIPPMPPRARMRRRGSRQRRRFRMTRRQVHDSFGATLDALPGRPASFLLYFLDRQGRAHRRIRRREMDRRARRAARRPLPDILVIGHTDTRRRPTPYNDKLSLAARRAPARDARGLGIPPARIRAAGRGERELLVPTDDNVASRATGASRSTSARIVVAGPTSARLPTGPRQRSASRVMSSEAAASSTKRRTSSRSRR